MYTRKRRANFVITLEVVERETVSWWNRGEGKIFSIMSRRCTSGTIFDHLVARNDTLGARSKLGALRQGEIEINRDRLEDSCTARILPR